MDEERSAEKLRAEQEQQLQPPSVVAPPVYASLRPAGLQGEVSPRACGRRYAWLGPTYCPEAGKGREGKGGGGGPGSAASQPACALRSPPSRPSLEGSRFS